MPLRTRNKPSPLLLAALGLGALPGSAGAAQELPAAVDAARDVTGEGLAALEVTAAPDAVFVDEEVEVRFRVTLARGFAETQLIQLFRRELDVPVQVRAPWLAGTETLVWNEVDREAPDGPRLALGGSVLRAAEAPPAAGADERVLELFRTYRPDRAGELRLEPAQLRFTYASAFEDDPFRGRVPVERQDAYVLSAPLELSVRPLPEEGRPPDFGGAVGSFEVEATAEPRDLQVGESLRWTLRIRGPGFLDAIQAPRLDALEGFRVLGWVEEPDEGGRRFAYDLAPESHRVDRVPAFSYPFFDPDLPGYRRVATAPITILVRPRASFDAPPAAPEDDAAPLDRPEAPSATPPAGDGLSSLPFWIAGGVLLVAWVWLHSRREDDPH